MISNLCGVKDRESVVDAIREIRWRTSNGIFFRSVSLWQMQSKMEERLSVWILLVDCSEKSMMRSLFVEHTLEFLLEKKSLFFKNN